MKVVEKFISINGEGRRAGELAVFIRFKGCNLNCSYCDTKWANEPACDYEELSPDDICEYVSETGIKNVTLTGGEPLLQKDIRSLVEKLLNKSDIRVEIETNGAVDIAPLANAFSKEKLSLTMDYKLPSSGCEEKMILSNMEVLRKQDTVKFVSGSVKDLECAEKIIGKFHLTERCQVFISPVFGSIEPVEIAQMIVKGHDFPDVTLMGIVAADLSLNAEDYRCAERTFQLLCQAVGRGGRGEKPGEAVIQTYHPDHYSIQAAAVQDYQAFYEEEMSYRMLLDYPPAAHMLAVLGSGPEDEKLVQAMYYLKLYIERIYRENDLHIIGPAYASVGKVKDIYRQVIYLKHKDHKTLVHIKDQLEKYIEINSGFRKIYIQFDFS